MLFPFPPTQKPTRAEYVVIVLFLSLLFVILGLISLVIGIRAPADRHRLAAALERRGIICIVIGFGIFFCFWLVRRIID